MTAHAFGRIGHSYYHTRLTPLARPAARSCSAAAGRLRFRDLRLVGLFPDLLPAARASVHVRPRAPESERYHEPHARPGLET